MEIVDDDVFEEQQPSFVTEANHKEYVLRQRRRIQAVGRAWAKQKEKPASPAREYLEELRTLFGLGGKLSPTDKAAPVPERRTLFLTERDWRQVS